LRDVDCRGDVERRGVGHRVGVFASLVAVVEAFAIILAVATLRGWRRAIPGTAAALAVLAIPISLLGPLLNLVPLRFLQFVIGVLLLLFRMGWLRKAILRESESLLFMTRMRSLRLRGLC
jgi:uncharacterized membrane protein